jgi:hypothetical protein
VVNDVVVDPPAVPYDLFVWAKPHDVKAEVASALVDDWQAAGGEPATSPFEPSTDVGWFARELLENAPGLETRTDAQPRTGGAPIWMSGSDEQPARVVAIRLSRPVQPDELEIVFSLATKYDLVVLDANRRTVHRPTEQLAAYASATFWPRGALRAAVAGIAGAALAAIAWVAGIPIVSGVAVVVGAFLVLMAVLTFVVELRSRLRGS